MNTDKRIRKVKVLQGRAKEQALEMGLEQEDLVILTTTANSFPEYTIEKIEGNALSYLLNRK